ncbi:hypothetical protein SA2016_0914 [Sinomonas atrocyanea]|uniref:Uncharacterized protein n=1 Tax=Sinomonas atrocyanea TaxID=37927 RepID=A0A127A1S7_9MICC|nr:hypothetical protein [Sinomonas atrocyanea]AMM31602.1 hypothetical protein SA2016_0914 [Sinomonas atrocyanea]GEB64258.1 hypothetical protein SAT01_17060 [Sinomonas atrocyanea]GGG57679.1 hypothetical protein GCM10007172_05670 [Sinomonas atrocyanea]
MTENSEAGNDRILHPSEETTIHDQIRGILAEALTSPHLPDHARARLRALLAEHHDRPGEAFLEHLRLIRSADAGASAPARLGQPFPAPAVATPLLLPEPAV